MDDASDENSSVAAAAVDPDTVDPGPAVPGTADADVISVRCDTAAGAAQLTIHPAAAAVGLFVVTHGSAGSVDASDLVIARGQAARLGWTVVTITQPFRLAGRRNPGRAELQDEAWCEIVAALRAGHPGPLVQAGRSNGARVACRTAGRVGAVGVVCLAFPVHPPGRPDLDRLAELAAPTVPVLVVQGDRDPFGVPPRARGRRVAIAPGSDHALRRADGLVAVETRRFLRARARSDGFEKSDRPLPTDDPARARVASRDQRRTDRHPA